MLISNTLFRMGGCAVLLSNKKCFRDQAKYTLLTTVRVHHGSDDSAYNTIYQCEDEAGYRGTIQFVKVILLKMRREIVPRSCQSCKQGTQIKSNNSGSPGKQSITKAVEYSRCFP